MRFDACYGMHKLHETAQYSGSHHDERMRSDTVELTHKEKGTVAPSCVAIGLR